MGTVVPFAIKGNRAAAAQRIEHELFDALELAEEMALTTAKAAIAFRTASQRLRDTIERDPACVMKADLIDPRLRLLQSLETSIASMLPILDP